MAFAKPAIGIAAGTSSPPPDAGAAKACAMRALAWEAACARADPSRLLPDALRHG